MQNHVRKIRESKKMTLEQVAELMGVTKAQVSKMERGIIRLNDMWLDKLSKLYNCSIHDLIDDDQPQRILPQNTRQSQPGEFVTATMLGYIDAKQVGMVEYIEPKKQYSLRFAAPAALKGRAGDFFALTVKSNLLGDYKDNTQLIFVNLNEHNKDLLKLDSVVIGMQKDRSGRDCGHFLRIIEKDENGMPYAVYKIKYGRRSYSTLVNTMLTGNMDIIDIMELYKDSESGKPAKVIDREIPLENNELVIKAVLVKSISDEG